jgi:hypothetical protein
MNSAVRVVCEIEELNPEKKSEKGLQKLEMYPKPNPHFQGYGVLMNRPCAICNWAV